MREQAAVAVSSRPIMTNCDIIVGTDGIWIAVCLNMLLRAQLGHERDAVTGLPAVLHAVPEWHRDNARAGKGPAAAFLSAACIVKYSIFVLLGHVEPQKHTVFSKWGSFTTQ